MHFETHITAEPGQKTIVMERMFDAPRRLVFEALTKPEYLKRWWGGNCAKLVGCDIDLRVGGAYRFVSRVEGGDEYAFKGVYREIAPPGRLVYTQIFDVPPYNTEEYQAIVTTDLEERDNKTFVRVVIEHASVEGRDQHVATGMEVGVRQSHDALDDLLVELRGPRAVEARA